MIIKRLLTGAIKIITLSLIILTFINSSAFASENVDYSVTISPSLTLTIPTSSIILNLDPSSRTFDSKNFTVSVGTNNKTGYKLTLSTPNDNTDLERDTSSDTTAISATIPTLDTGTYTESTFTVNKWGYKINTNTAIPSIITSDYIPFTSGNTLMERDTAVNQDQAELSFASKIDYLQPAGAYNTTLQFNIVANPLVQYMQDWAGCSVMNTGDVITLMDSRDNEEYLVGKLADGNCWMLENLRLDISDTTVQSNLDSTTTNATDTVLNYLINGGGSSPYPANGVIAKTATGGSWADSYPNPYIATQYRDVIQTAVGSAPAGKIGIFYNFCAASAGSYCYSNGTGKGSPSYDVCPKGWRLPIVNEYTTLYNSYGNVADFMLSLSTPLSGNFVENTLKLQGTNGYFWTSTFATGQIMRDLRITASTVSYGNSAGRYCGFSVRCIAK